MTTIVREFTYTKANGETSPRKCIEISAPRKNNLMLDVAALDEEELALVVDVLDDIDDYREERMKTIGDLVKWRTFKAEGIS